MFEYIINELGCKFHDEFEPEFDSLPKDVKTELQLRLVVEYPNQRPITLVGISEIEELKEITD